MPAARCVLLRHTLPDGSWHYDFMLQAPGADPDEPLTTFRVRDRIDTGAGPFDAERLSDHRAAYLDYQGPVSGDRGRVERVAAGACLELTPEPFAAVCDWGRGPVRYTRDGAQIVRTN